MNSNKVVELHPPAPVHAPCNSGSLSNQKIDYLSIFCDFSWNKNVVILTQFKTKNTFISWHAPFKLNNPRYILHTSTTLFRSITVLHGTDNNLQKIPPFKLNVMNISQNIVNPA